MHPDTDAPHEPVPPIVDRDDAPEQWSSLWSLALLALLALMLLHACVRG